MKTKSILIIAGILGAVAVITGAMGAHALKEILSENSLNSFLTGARYNMYGAIVLLGISGNSNFIASKWLKISVILTLIGTVLFSGSIYLLSTIELSNISGFKALGPITPIGGVLIISGWISIVIGAISKK